MLASRKSELLPTLTTRQDFVLQSHDCTSFDTEPGYLLYQFIITPHETSSQAYDCWKKSLYGGLIRMADGWCSEFAYRFQGSQTHRITLRPFLSTRCLQRRAQAPDLLESQEGACLFPDPSHSAHSSYVAFGPRQAGCSSPLGDHL